MVWMDIFDLSRRKKFGMLLRINCLKQWRFTAAPALAITKAIADFILLDGHPASIVEGEGFQQLLKLAEPRYVCPSRTYFQHVSNDAVLFLSCLSSVYACLCRRIFLHCTTKSSCFRNRLCMITFPLSHLPTRVIVRSCPVPILTILFRSQRTCGRDPTMSPTSVLLLTGSIHTGNCSMLCWTSSFARIDTLVKIWWSGSSKSCAPTTFAYARSNLVLLCFWHSFFLSFVAAP